jgi:hypothetical protein
MCALELPSTLFHSPLRSQLGIHVEVYGPETTMTFIVKRATDDLVKDGSIKAE